MLAWTQWTTRFLGAGILVVLPVAMAAGQVAAQSHVRYYEKDGVTYREVRRVVQRPVVEMRTQSRERTVYRAKETTEVQPRTRTVYTPVTTYYWRGQWRDVLNPFRPAYVDYHLAPYTHWKARTEKYDATVTRREWVPQTEVVQVPVTTRRYVNEEVIRRTVVHPAPGRVSTVAQRPAFGGISQIQNDPPRRGSNWHAATGSVQR